MENKLNKIVMQRPVEVFANSDLYTYKGEEKIDDNSPLIVVSETKSLHLVIKDEGMSVKESQDESNSCNHLDIDLCLLDSHGIVIHLPILLDDHHIIQIRC